MMLKDGLTAEEWDALNIPLAKIKDNTQALQTVFSLNDKRTRDIERQNEEWRKKNPDKRLAS